MVGAKLDLWFHAKATIIMCLSDEVLYNVMNEETTVGLWCKPERLYMMKSLLNKFFMKKTSKKHRYFPEDNILLHDDSQRRTDGKLIQNDWKHYCW